MLRLAFPVVLALSLSIGAFGTVRVMTVFPDLATVYPEQAVETAIAQPIEQAGHHRADAGTERTGGGSYAGR
jgi:hypothetical protein